MGVCEEELGWGVGSGWKLTSESAFPVIIIATASTARALLVVGHSCGIVDEVFLLFGIIRGLGRRSLMPKASGYKSWKKINIYFEKVPMFHLTLWI